ncbi:hypothetical protein Tco_1408504 [Tanacetum coccineum]
MSNQPEDIQAASFDTRPPMLDRTDFESWQQRIRFTYKGKDHGEYILQSIDEGPFKMGWCRDEIATGTGGPYLGPERDRVVADLSQAEKNRLRVDIRATNVIGRFTKLINDMRHIKMTIPKIQRNFKFVNNMLLEWGRFVTMVKLNRGLKESNHDQLYAYLKQHELHANENKMLMERLDQHSHDPLSLVSNVSPYQYPSSSSVPPQPSYIPPVMGALSTELNSDYFKEKMLLMQAQENKDLDEEQLLFLAADQCDAFDSDVDEAPTAQTMFMANLSSGDPVYDEVGPSYDSDTLSEPTRRKFTLGEQCPLTTFTESKVVLVKQPKSVSTSDVVITERLSNTSHKPLTRTPTEIGDPTYQTLHIRLFSNAGRTDRPLIFGLRLFKTYDGGSLTAQEFREKVHQDNNMADENVPAPAPTRFDDQILPFAEWVPIGKSNFILDLQKKQRNLIFPIFMDILQNTNFFRAFSASASVPAIYLQ